MKKYLVLLVLLVSTSIFAQLDVTSVKKLKITTNVEDNTTSKVLVVSSSGLINWRNLPLTASSLASTLAVDNKTNELAIVSNNGKAYLDVFNAYAKIGFTGAGTASYIEQNGDDINVFSSSTFNVNSSIAIDFNSAEFFWNGSQVATLADQVFGILDEGNGDGYLLLGRNAANYGNIGQDAVDLSISASAGSYGATGHASFAAGYGNTASGEWATAMGVINVASGERSFSVGGQNTSSGYGSFTSGQLNTASATFSTTIGESNYGRTRGELSLGHFGTDYTPVAANGYDVADRILNVGVGASGAARKDGLTLYKSGLLRLPEVSTAEIDAGDGKSVVTREWVEANSGSVTVGISEVAYGDGSGVITSSEKMMFDNSEGKFLVVPTGTDGVYLGGIGSGTHGVYSNYGDQIIADFEPVGNVYRYAGGVLTYDGGGANLLYTSAKFKVVNGSDGVIMADSYRDAGFSGIYSAQSDEIIADYSPADSEYRLFNGKGIFHSDTNILNLDVETLDVVGDVNGDVANFDTVLLKGTAGAGHIKFPLQNGGTPSIPATGFALYANATGSGYPTFLDSSNRTFVFSSNLITAGTARVYEAPNADGVLALLQNDLTASTVNAPTASAVNTGLGLKLNAANPAFTGLFSGTGTAQTGSSANGVIDIAQTWNTTGTPTAFKMNITNTASNNNSLLMDIQVGGASQFKIARNGGVVTFSQGAISLITEVNSVTTNSLAYATASNQFTAQKNFNPSSGSAGTSGFVYQNTINQTGSASGITRGLYINPTLTAAADFRAIDVTAGRIVFSATNTASGTTGAQTINKISGIVNFAAGASTLVVTNNLVTVDSIVNVQVEGTDATATHATVTKANGSFTINLNAAATAETAVSFITIN